MAPASNEEQFKFLISCIRYSNNGKVDFGQVAKECSIVSKGAAAKRYERMMRAHGIASYAASIKPNTASSRSSTANERTSSNSTSTTNARKRKANQFIEDPNPADDEEGFGSGLNVKDEVQGQDRGPRIKNQMHFKEESGEQKASTATAATGPQLQSLEDASELLRFYTPEEGEPYGLEDGDNFYAAGDYTGGYTGGAGSALNGEGASFSPSKMTAGSASGSAPTGYGPSATKTGYGMHTSPAFEFSSGHGNFGASGYRGSGMSSMTRSPPQVFGYQSQIYQADNKGHQESPFLVE